MIELIASKSIRHGAEVLELYQISRATYGHREWSAAAPPPTRPNVIVGYRLVWAERLADGRKPAMLDVRDIASRGRALAAFDKAK